MEPEEEHPDSPVKQFFLGKTIFITGATGFMGKVISKDGCVMKLTLFL
jgi:FlaA1/EpsC-like NDP-sugar epimerase